MQVTSKRAGTIVAVWAALQVAACESPSGPDLRTQPDSVAAPDTVLSLSGISVMEAGKLVTLSGTNLDRLTNLRVDGEDVTFEVLSRGHAQFTMPDGAVCDTDGRRIEISANTTRTIYGALRVENVLRLEVGQSKIFSASELSCIQLSSAAENFILSVASLSRGTGMENVVRFQAPGQQGGANGMAGNISNLNMGSDSHEAAMSQPAHSMGGPNALTPFDDYAGAAVGDVLEFVDWSTLGSFATNREDVDTYQAVVVAATDGQLIVADLRQPNAEQFSTADVRDRFQRAAEIVDLHGLRAIHATIDPGLVLPDGAGGRVVTMIHPMPAHVLGGFQASDIYDRDWSSDMFTTTISNVHANVSPGLIASTIIHEMAHLADALPDYRGTASRSTGWYSESLAVWTEDVAARMSKGAESPTSRLDADHVASRIATARPVMSASRSPWSSSVDDGSGMYDRGARILRHAAEQMGLAGFSQTETLHQRIRANAPSHRDFNGDLEPYRAAWSIEVLAGHAGMSVEALLAESMMADLTDDLLPAAAVAAHNVPQTSSWDRTPAYAGVRDPLRTISKTAGLNQTVAVTQGGYAYWYIYGDGEGLSIEAVPVDMQPHHEVRLTRMR